MYEPRNKKTLLVLIAVLLLANIAGLAYFFMNKSVHKKNDWAMQRKNAMKSYLKNDLGFSSVQLQQYDSFNGQHHRLVEPMFEQLKTEKENRLRFLAENKYADSSIYLAVSRSAERQKMLDIQMLLHLKDIRSLCTDAQKQMFDTSIYRMMSRRGGDRKKSIK